jgi:TPR repeat protein
LKKAADAGNADALAKLGQDTYFGNDGITKDPTAAIPLIQAAAEKENPWACDTMGILYLKGEGVPKDSKKATEFLSKGTHAAPLIH